MLSSGSFDNLLNHIETRQGGTIDIQYAPSTQYTNPLLPFAIPVVSSMIVDDGNPLKNSQGVGSASTTTYSYSGGYYSFGEREFRGFSQVTVNGPAGPNNERSITTTWFHQGDGRSATGPDNPSVTDAFMRGKPYRIRTEDANGSGYTEQVINYVDSVSLPHFNPRADTTVSECKDSSNCKSSKTAFDYDEHGNVTRKEVQPDLADSTHDQTVVRTFDPNTTAWIVSLPSSEMIYAGTGANLALKVKTEYFYDGASSCAENTYNTSPQKGKVTGIRNWLDNGTSPETRMAYDSYGNKMCDKDAKIIRDPVTNLDTNANIYTYKYDPTYKNLLKEIVPPLNNKIPSTKYTYYGVDGPGDGLFGQLKSSEDANGNKTMMFYDAFGRIQSVNYPDQTWERILYTDHSIGAGIGVQNVRVDNSAGLWSVSYFDGMGKTFTLESKGPDGKIIVKDTVFDARNQVYKTSYPYFKNLDTRVWNATVARDYLGRVISTSKPGKTGDVTVKIAYDLRSIDTIDENDHLVRKIMNGLGLVAEVDEFTGTYSGTPLLYARTTYEYDILGHLTKVTDTKHNETIITYDTLGRKKSSTDPDMGTWNYTYYPNGLLWTTEDAKHQLITYTYDELNRVQTKHYPSGPDVVYTYDEATSSNPKGRLTRMTYPTGQTTGQTVFNYDTMGRISGKTATIDGVPYPLAFGYLNGRLDKITYPDSEVVAYAYNGPNIQNVGSYVGYQNIDALGRPWNAAYDTAGATSSYTYHAATKRLDTLIVATPGLVKLVDNSYAYDNKGNVTGITDNLNTSLPLNVLSETYTPARAHLIDHTGSGRVYLPDDNGNIVSDGTRTITYNYDNLPTSINANTFSYDGNGQRVKKNNTVYVDKFYECTSGICSKYIYAGNSRVAIKTNGVTLYYHSDHLGSTSVVTNVSGGKEESMSYYPFGGIRKDDGGVINLKHKYTGQELDGETGLYNYGARLYDPEIGRFISPDSIVPNPLNPQSLNRYAYVLNNPMNLVDPTGHVETTAEISVDFSLANAPSNSSATTPNANQVSNVDKTGMFTRSLDDVEAGWKSFMGWLGGGSNSGAGVSVESSNPNPGGNSKGGESSGNPDSGGNSKGGGSSSNSGSGGNSQGDQWNTAIGVGLSIAGNITTTVTAGNANPGAIVADLALNSLSYAFAFAPDQQLSDKGGFLASYTGAVAGIARTSASILATPGLQVLRGAAGVATPLGLGLSSFSAGFAAGVLINHAEMPFTNGMSIEQSLTEGLIYHRNPFK